MIAVQTVGIAPGDPDRSSYVTRAVAFATGAVDVWSWRDARVVTGRAVG